MRIKLKKEAYRNSNDPKSRAIPFQKYSLHIALPPIAAVKFIGNLVMGQFLNAAIPEVFNVPGIFTGGFAETCRDPSD